MQQKLPELVLTKDQKQILDKFVLKKFRKLGPEKFKDNIVAADATLANVLYVLDNYVVLPQMILESRKRLRLHILKKNQYRPRILRSNKRVHMSLDYRSGMLAIRGG